MYIPVYSELYRNDTSLRPYQQKAKKEIFDAWDEVDNVMFQMPTGTGKTRLFTSIISDINAYSIQRREAVKILIIAHRTELIDQIDGSLTKYKVAHNIIAGGRKKNYKFPVNIASIQTITNRNNLQDAKKLNVQFIIIDEAHHALAATYKKLWDMYPNSKKLGVTATPWRMNHQSFTDLFDQLVLSMPIKEFIKKGYLAPYKYYSLRSNSDIQKTIDGIELDRFGEYKEDSMEEKMDIGSIRAQLLDSYLSFAEGKKGIIYAINIVHAKHICEEYKKAGYKAVSIDSKTPAGERKDLVNKFKRGFIDIIVNVDIFSEGFDCPDIEFIQLARPTRSLVKYLQQVGRGLRPTEDKHNCVILDNVGMYSRFGVPDARRHWKHHFLGKDVVEEVYTGKTKGIGRRRHVDMSEGTEDMELIQDVGDDVEYSSSLPISSENRSGTAWTIKEENSISKFFQQGHSFDTIAKAIGRSVNAVLSRLGKLGLIDYEYGQEYKPAIEEQAESTNEEESVIELELDGIELANRFYYPAHDFIFQDCNHHVYEIYLVDNYDIVINHLLFDYGELLRIEKKAKGLPDDDKEKLFSEYWHNNHINVIAHIKPGADSYDDLSMEEGGSIQEINYIEGKYTLIKFADKNGTRYFDYHGNEHENADDIINNVISDVAKYHDFYDAPKHIKKEYIHLRMIEIMYVYKSSVQKTMIYADSDLGQAIKNNTEEIRMLDGNIIITKIPAAEENVYPLKVYFRNGVKMEGADMETVRAKSIILQNQLVERITKLHEIIKRKEWIRYERQIKEIAASLFEFEEEQIEEEEEPVEEVEDRVEEPKAEEPKVEEPKAERDTEILEENNEKGQSIDEMEIEHVYLDEKGNVIRTEIEGQRKEEPKKENESGFSVSLGTRVKLLPSQIKGVVVNHVISKTGERMLLVKKNSGYLINVPDNPNSYEVLKKQRRRISEMENPNMNTDIKRKGSELNIGSVIQMVYSGKIYTVVGFVKKKLVYKLVVMGKDGSEKEIWDNPALYKIIK